MLRFQLCEEAHPVVRVHLKLHLAQQLGAIHNRHARLIENLAQREPFVQVHAPHARRIRVRCPPSDHIVLTVLRKTLNGEHVTHFLG